MAKQRRRARLGQNDARQRRQRGEPPPPPQPPAPVGGERRCSCECQSVGTIRDRLVYRGAQVYFNLKVRTVCAIDLGLAQPVQANLIPDDPGSRLAPPTKCQWIIKIWRDRSDPEPQWDDVTVFNVRWKSGLTKQIEQRIPQQGDIQVNYPAAFECERGALQILVEIGKIGQEETLLRLYTVDGCSPCPPPRPPATDSFGG